MKLRAFPFGAPFPSSALPRPAHKWRACAESVCPRPSSPNSGDNLCVLPRPVPACRNDASVFVSPRRDFRSHQNPIKPPSGSHQEVIRRSSGGHQEVIRSGGGQPPGGHQEVIRRLAGGHPEVTRWSSGGHQTAGGNQEVIRRSSGGHQEVTGRSSGGHQEVIRKSSGNHNFRAPSPSKIVPRRVSRPAPRELLIRFWWSPWSPGSGATPRGGAGHCRRIPLGAAGNIWAPPRSSRGRLGVPTGAMGSYIYNKLWPQCFLYV